MEETHQNMVYYMVVHSLEELNKKIEVRYQDILQINVPWHVDLINIKLNTQVNLEKR